MQNAISNKIRLLLNELAILNQPEVIDGKFFFNPETLSKIKSLSAEMYLCTDNLLHNSPPVVVESPKGSMVEVNSLELAIPELTIEAESIVQPEVEKQDFTLNAEVDEETTTELISPELSHKLEPDPVTEIPSIQESKIDTPSTTLPPELPIVGNTNPFSGKISLTRRFEYINNLFSGNSNEFEAFLNKIVNSASLDDALGIFDSEYESRGWKRKAEAASDLKSLIRKNKV